MVTHPAPPQTRTWAMHAYGSSSRASAAPYAVPWGSGDTIGEHKVSLVCLPTGTLCSTAPSLPWVAWASLPHLHRYDAPLRLPPPRLGGFAWRSPARYLACFRVFVVSQKGSWSSGSPRPCQGLWSPGPPIRVWNKETGGSPTFPSSPYGYMPRSQTPVVSCTLAIPRPGLRPSGACTPSAFPSMTTGGIASLSTTLPIAGLHHAACVLATPGFIRPLTGRHAGALLTGWRGVRQVGLEPWGSHPLGNNNQFHGLSPNPKVSSLPWREHALVRQGPRVI